MNPTSSSRRRALVALGTGLAASGGTLFVAATAHAQSFPSKPITLIVPGPAGGTPDVMARQLARAMERELGQAIVVDNRSGAAGIIGVQAAAQATPDGHTLLMGFAQTMAINAVTFRKLPYDPVADFVPVARLVEFELALVVPASVPATTVPELAAWLKANADRAAFGSFGPGTPSQFAGAMFCRKIGASVVHVPYKGSAPLTTELIGGQVQFGFVVPQVALPHVRSGKLRMLAVTGERRSPNLPSVPTMKELGFDEIVAGGWYGVFAPKGTPPVVVERLGRAIADSMKSTSLRGTLVAQDLRPAYLGGREFAAFQESEIARWRAIAVRTNFTAGD